MKTTLNGIKFDSILELMEFAKLMALSGATMPKHLRYSQRQLKRLYRGEPVYSLAVGRCLAVVMFSVEHELDPFMVAHRTVMVKSRLKFPDLPPRRNPK